MPLSPARGVGRALADRLFVRGTVTGVDQITRRMRRITVTAPGLSWTPGQQVRVAADGLLTRRTYLVWDYDGSSLELYVLDHGDGPGARWARTVRPGDDVVFGGPEGGFVTRPSPYHLFAGEETASVAFGPMIRALGDAPVYGCWPTALWRVAGLLMSGNRQPRDVVVADHPRFVQSSSARQKTEPSRSTRSTTKKGIPDEETHFGSDRRRCRNRRDRGGRRDDRQPPRDARSRWCVCGCEGGSEGALRRPRQGAGGPRPEAVVMGAAP
jgi:hypothetical protein